MTISNVIGAESCSPIHRPKEATTILALAEYKCFHQTLNLGDSEWSYWVEKDLGSQFGAVISSHAIYILGANRENDSEPSSKVIIYNKMSSNGWKDLL